MPRRSGAAAISPDAGLTSLSYLKTIILNGSLGDLKLRIHRAHRRFHSALRHADTDDNPVPAIMATTRNSTVSEHREGQGAPRFVDAGQFVCLFRVHPFHKA
jgi:hypothetical protein